MENNNNAFNKPPKNNKTKLFRFNLYWMYGIIFIMLAALYMTNDSSTTKEMGWTEFQKLANKKKKKKITQKIIHKTAGPWKTYHLYPLQK